MDKSASSSIANGAPASQTQSHPTPVRESSSSARRADLTQSTRPSTHTSQATSASNSAAASPFASREVSPTRPSARSHTVMKTATAAAASAPLLSAAPVSSTPQPSQPSQTSYTPQLAQTTQPSQKSQSPGTSGTRSRRNSHQESSPSRASRSSIPTLAARPATLSSAATPTLLPSTPAESSRNPAPQKSEQPRDNPRWPVSPRLRSPPPSLNRPDAAPASTQAAAPTFSTPAVSTSTEAPPSPTTSVGPSAIPAISLQRAAVEPAPTPSDSEAEEPHQQSGMRTPMRGMLGNVPTLETVQEASPLGSPQLIDAALEKLETDSIISDAGTSTVSEVVEVSPVKTLRARQIAHQYQAESGSESGGGGGGAISSGSKASRRGPTSAPAPSLTSRHSSVSKGSGKGKTTEGSQPTMTVETETVTSIPNVAVGPASATGPNGSLRTKPSTETIRPKKEKKKSRKQASVTPGTATSKADIFEAKVASAVDEANTSDSEETFVYDSNPADARERPHRFHHSRTPSATSVANDRNGMRSIHSVLEGGPGPSGVTMKKSMKFVNTFGNTSGNDSAITGDEETKGSAGRGTTPGSGRGTARLHHHVGGGGSHIGRWGLSGPKNGHQSIFDNESPFPVTSARLKLPHGGSNSSIGGRHNAGNTSPRPTGSVSARGSGAFSKRGLALGGVSTGGYDMDEATTGADDERTPLISPSMRGTTRNGRPHRHPMTLRSLEQQSYHHHPPASFLNRFASCLVLTVMLMLVISGAIGFMFATSQPLEDIELVKISGVIASEQELMFDLMVRAHNPNVVVVTVDAADMEVFAKSPHAGTDSEWWRRPHRGTFRTQRDDEASEGGDAAVTTQDDRNNTSLDALDNVPRDQPDSSPNFLLGKFTEFDNPLSFEGSFFHHGLSTSRSGVRIRRPGNGTDGGSERWERILDDEFDLIVKGVLRYSLPLSQRVRSALIEGRTTVKPNAADDPKNKTATVTVSRDADDKVENSPPEGSSLPLFTDP